MAQKYGELRKASIDRYRAKKRQIVLVLPPELFDRITATAQENGQSKQGFIINAICDKINGGN